MARILENEGEQMIPTWAQNLTADEWAIVGEAVIMLYDNCCDEEAFAVDKNDMRIIERLATAVSEEY
tara:strand:- start:687 stop:887 length:201 start_codon:yes stop_codon:yes gene_type:complete